MARHTTTEEPILTIEIGKGLADRNRLPLPTVTRFLNEFKALISAIGRDLQTANGIQEATGDFGLEIVAGGKGNLFTKGSVRTQIAITRDPQTGVVAAQTVLRTLQLLNQGARKPATTETKFKPLEAKVVPYLDKMAFIASSAKSEARFSLKQDIVKTGRAPIKGVFGELAVKQLREVRPKPVFIEHGVTAYGKLYELKDTSQELTDASTAFWGELRLDNGQKWRIQFAPGMESVVVPLFRKQVRITGDAHYYQQRTTKIIARDADLDEERDYEAAFDELWGSEKDTLGKGSFRELLDARYGE
jgi:hypothetical protein